MRLALLNIYAILVIFCLAACGKESGSQSGQTKTDLLTSSPWKIDQIGVDADKNGSIDLPQTLQNCELDNTFTFKKDGTGIFDEGATKCNDTDPQSGSYSWSFINNESGISGDIPQLGFSGNATINTLSSTSFVLYKDTLIQGSPTSLRLVLKMKH
jgi:hypothetical protein